MKSKVSLSIVIHEEFSVLPKTHSNFQLALVEKKSPLYSAMDEGDDVVPAVESGDSRSCERT
jgi:hypothetical protein